MNTKMRKDSFSLIIPSKVNIITVGIVIITLCMKKMVKIIAQMKIALYINQKDFYVDHYKFVLEGFWGFGEAASLQF